jgi:acetylornithine deacetylase
LLNSHHDTVKPVSGWQRDPFGASLEGTHLYGLGSNDAGASLVGLLAAFEHLAQAPQPYNLIWAGTAEEEISGANGIASLLPLLPPIDLAIVGEPTQMQLAIAEKGLMVLDCYAHGQAGHAARQEGVNAIYKALPDIQWFANYRFEQVSPVLGEVRMTVSQVQAGTQHNVVPDRCHWVVDVRTTECYSNEALLAEIKAQVSCEVVPRSLRLQSSGIALTHPVVQRGLALGKTTYGSPTLSDQALMPFPSLKIGIGDSARSHTADEYIVLSELESGIADYIALLDQLVFPPHIL